MLHQPLPALAMLQLRYRLLRLLQHFAVAQELLDCQSWRYNLRFHHKRKRRMDGAECCENGLVF